MQSKKRFTEINIWDDPVFIELTPQQKLMWFFLNDRCDNIGLWVPNPKLIGFNLDIEGNTRQFLDEFLKAINEAELRVHVLPSGDWLITDFVKFQYCKKSPLHENNPAHKSYLHLIEEKDLLSWFCANYPETMPESYLNKVKKNSLRPLKEPFETHKDTDKDKESDKEKAQEDDEVSSELVPFTNFAP